VTWDRRHWPHPPTNRLLFFGWLYRFSFWKIHFSIWITMQTPSIETFPTRW
jgi:hypothetical protein